MMLGWKHHDVRTTLTIDEDVAVLLQREVRRTGDPFKVTVNRLLRRGLEREAMPPAPKPFKVKPFRLDLPKEWTSGNVEELIEMLEGPLHR